MTIEVQVISDWIRLVARQAIEMILLGNESHMFRVSAPPINLSCKYLILSVRSISDIRLETHLGKDSTSSNNSNYGSRGALAWTPPASMEGSTPTWTEGTPSFTESSSSENGEIGSACRHRSEIS